MNGQRANRHLNICMLLPFPRHSESMRVPPQIGICSYLTNFGHKVSWVIWSDTKQWIEPFLLEGVEVHTTREIPYLPASLLPGRVFNRIANTIRRLRHVLTLFRDRDYDLVFVRDDVFDAFIAHCIKTRYKVPFVYELSNPLEQSWEHQKLEPKQPRLVYYVIARVIRFLADRCVREADLVLPTTTSFQQHLATQGIPEMRMMPYPNGVDVASFLHQNGKGISERYGLSNSRVAIYVGTLGKARHLKMLIEAFAHVRTQRADIKLLIVGEGSDEESLRNLSTALGLAEDVVFVGQMPQSQVPDFIAAADIGISPVPPLWFYKLSSPIKMFEYMAMAKPVVANEEIPEHKEVLEESRAGILAPFTAEALAGAIIELLDNPEAAIEMGNRGREWVVSNRSYEVLARQLESRILSLF